MCRAYNGLFTTAGSRFRISISLYESRFSQLLYQQGNPYGNVSFSNIPWHVGDDGSALLVRLLDVGMNSRVEFKNRSVKICRGHQTFWYRPLNPKR